MRRLSLILLTLSVLAGSSFAEFYNLSPNMSLPVPQVGVEPGPQYANDINASLLLIDSHNHTSGNGVQVPSAGININSDLTFGQNNATSVKSCRFSAQNAPLSGPSDLGAVYESGVDLYYNDGNGNQIRITQSGGVVGTPGSISGLASPASATYVAASSTFVWQSAANTGANMDMAAVTLRNLSASSNGITIQPHAALGANYTMTLPGALPGTNNGILLTSSSGAQTFLDQGSANQVLRMNSAGTAQEYSTIDTANITNAAVTATKIETNTNLNGSAVKENGKNVAVSNTNATNSLAIIRGVFHWNGSSIVIDTGEGFSVARNSAGDYTVSYSSAFADAPAFVANSNPGTIQPSTSISASSQRIFTSGGIDAQVFFIAIGQRN